MNRKDTQTMGLWHAYARESGYLTLIVRAPDERRAKQIATKVIQKYNPDDECDEVSWINPRGPEGIVVEDPS